MAQKKAKKEAVHTQKVYKVVYGILLDFDDVHNYECRHVVAATAQSAIDRANDFVVKDVSKKDWGDMYVQEVELITTLS